jgi:hypothetical protein
MSSDSSDDDLTLPAELLERERQLIERNRELEARVADLLRSTSLESSEISAPKRAKPPPKGLPAARASPTKPGIIEVEVPTHVEAVAEVRIDRVPELREAFHKIALEISSINEQIRFIEANKTKCEATISKLQAELKRAKVEGERAQQVAVETTKQTEAAQERLAELKSQISAARLTRIERVQQDQDAKQKLAQMDQKVRRQRALADRLQSELNAMQTVDARSAKMNSEKTKLQQGIDEQKRAIRGLRALLAEVQRVAAHEEKVFDHIQSGRNLPLTSEVVERAITELI